MGRRRPVPAYASTYNRCGRRQDGGPSPLRTRHSVVTLLYLLRTVRSVPWSAPARTARQDISPSRSGSWPLSSHAGFMVVLRHSSAYAADRAARQGPRTDSRSMRGPCAVESVGVLPAGELQHPEQNSIDADDDAEGEDPPAEIGRAEEHTSELQSRGQLVCRLLLEKK